MAVRDRNMFAWQAYVITMAFVSVGLLLGMFFLWRSYSDLSKRFEDQGGQLSTAQEQVRTNDGRVDRLLSMMGYGNYTQQDLDAMAERFATDEKLGQVETDFAEQMKNFPPGQQEKNLIKLPAFLLDTIRQRNDQIAKSRERAETLQKENADIVDRETKARQDAVAKQQAAEADLEKARQDHAAAIAKLNTEKEEALKKFDDYKALVDKQVAVLKQENSQLQAETTRQAATIREQMEIINQYRDPDFAAPQGEIVRVANGGTDIWINLGKQDGLRVGVPFSIIDASEVRMRDAKPKAKLQVVSVDEQFSRARLTEKNDYRNPIVTGDKVFSPAWRPGRTVGFALVGKMDVNGDGRDDTDRVREMIRMAGGKIDEEMDTKQSRSGPGMTPNTSFLVLGTDLTLPDSANPEQIAQHQQKIEAYAEFMNEARQNGIIQINLDKLMGYLKIDGADRTIPLGERTRAEDFPIRSQTRPPVSQGSVSDLYKPRQPR